VRADGDDDDGDGGMLRALLGDGDDEGGEDAGGRGGDGLRAQAALDALDDELDEGGESLCTLLFNSLAGRERQTTAGIDLEVARMQEGGVVMAYVRRLH
jgi:hypothetical protein